jgi:DNA-binding transcriptional LysR family regulator
MMIESKRCAIVLSPSAERAAAIVRHRAQMGCYKATTPEEPPRSVSLVYPSARLLPVRTRVFIEFMKQELKATLS